MRLPPVFFAFLTLLPVCCSSAFGETFLGVDRERIERVIALGYNLEPGVAEEIAALEKEFPESPVSGLLETGFLYWEQSYAEWDEALKAKFEERSEAALEKAQAYRKANRKDPDAQFAEAMIELSQVIYYVDHGRLWAAFWKSRGSLKTMKRLVDNDPNYHDAKLALGMANCYLSKTPGYLKPLAFLMRFKGDWETGLKYMREAKAGGLICKVDAGYYLGGIKIELDGDREAARDEFAELATRYPGNLKFRSFQAELERGMGRQQVAWDVAQTVIADERIEAYPAIKLRTLNTLLWASLGIGAYEETFALADEIEAMLVGRPFLEGHRGWATHARAEALQAQGRTEEALELWASIDSSNPAVRATADRRSAAVRAEEGM